MEQEYKYHSQDTHFRWKLKWRLESLTALRSMGDTIPLRQNESKYTSFVWDEWKVARQFKGTIHPFKSKRNNIFVFHQAGDSNPIRDMIDKFTTLSLSTDFVNLASDSAESLSELSWNGRISPRFCFAYLEKRQRGKWQGGFPPERPTPEFTKSFHDNNPNLPYCLQKTTSNLLLYLSYVFAS